MPTRAELANAIRALSMDAIDKAKSGHPGAPLGMADMAESLWRGFMKHNPADPSWANRDRFVLSNGHASMLIYSLLHLTGYDLSMDDIRNFRQFGAKTAGHPELGVAPGVEMTTGPLGQGISTAVGMALAERLLATEFNREGFPVMDHFTYVFVGDGCLMEGVAQEACSLAGTWKLGRLIALYDANDISIDGNVKGWFSEDVPARFEAMGWHVVRGIDGHDPEAVDMAIREAQAVTDKPSLIVCKTVIGKGAPTKAGSAGCHGAPLGAEETAAAKAALGWTADPFTVPADIKAAWDHREAGAASQKEWEDMFAAYAAAYPELAAEFKRRMAGELPANWAEVAAKAIEKACAEPKAVATRVSGKNVLNDIAPALPEIIGGSADLSGSVGTQFSGAKSLDINDYTGNYIHYGVREFGMGTVMNGLQLHGGFIPYGGTFFVFSDYAKNVIRSAAIMARRVVWVLTHDSIGVGEDGPTHQPIEQICGLRTMPNNLVWRPCDSAEAAVAWTTAVEHKTGPVCLIMSRQNLNQQARSAEQVEAIRRGGYVLKDCEGTPELIYIATGSEVQLVMEAAEQLAAQGRKVRVVSMPCCELFDQQDAAYREAVLPSAVRARVAVEAQAAGTWWKYVGLDGRVVAMDSFGASAPAGTLFPHFGFTMENVVKQALELL